jgi:hexosaminidase
MLKIKIKSWYFSGLLLLLINCNGDVPTFEMIEPVSIIPMPQDFHYNPDSFILNPDTKICSSQSDMEAAEHLREVITAVFGLDLEIASSFEESNCIRLSSTALVGDSLINTEGYRLSILPNRIEIHAKADPGLFWGLQTLHQVFDQTDHQDGFAARIQGLEIVDHPLFSHRGLLLDCCRHFFSKEVVKKYIKLLSYYKMNVLHWHLTEDQGWRIEINKYPSLTGKAAWRKESDGEVYGGFYSKEDIKEIVKFAESLNVTIIPEIELPGHSQAAISAYPHLSCQQKQVSVANDWGVFKEIYCAGNDSTFAFLEDVLLEVMELFPSEYIHIGGDEAPKYRWENCSKCQSRIASERLEDEHELQSYFIQRVENFLNSHGRKLIGWDEILEGGLSKNATVQSWRGMEGGTHAAETGHSAIMSPTSHCYIDYPLDAIDLKRVFSFNPIPDSLAEENEKYILGGEVNMWTEHVPDEANLDSKVFPRMLALSEVLWTGTDTSRYVDFRDRVYDHFDILDSLGISYGSEAIPLSLSTRGDSAYLNKEVKDIEIEYLMEKSLADIATNDTNHFMPYTGPIDINNDCILKARAMKGSDVYGETIQQKFCTRSNIVEPPNYKNRYSENYIGGGDRGLVDGKLGSLNFRDGNWQGFWGKNLVITLELEEGQKVHEVSANFYHYVNSWIFRPVRFVVAVSDNGVDWPKVGIEKPEINEESRGKQIVTMKVKLKEPQQPKFVRIMAWNVNIIPDWHEAAGSDAWLFIDEIIIK